MFTDTSGTWLPRLPIDNRNKGNRFCAQQRWDFVQGLTEESCSKTVF